VRILLCNNFVRGASGTDADVLIEERGLRELGHEVTLLRRDNTELDRAGPARKAALLASSVYSLTIRRQVTSLLDGTRHDIVHVNNVVPLLTGSIYDACRGRCVTVHTLRNFRAVCPSSYLFRDGHPCDECRRWAALPAVLHGCYRGSRLQSAGLVAARWVDRAKGRPLGHAADHYFAVSEHMRRRHAEWGIDPERVSVVPNPAEDLGRLAAEARARDGLAGEVGDAERLASEARARDAGGRAGMGGALPGERARPVITYVGTLLEAKGVGRLLDLAAALPDFHIRFIGSGPDQQALERRAWQLRLANVELCGFLAGAERVPRWAGSFLTVVPSLWEEPFGVIVPESYSLGIPVLTTGTGGLAELVSDEVTGLIDGFSDIPALAARLRALLADEARYRAMSSAARERYESGFTTRVFARNVERGFQTALDAAGRTRGRTQGRGF
jgi:glycosyltransferase involved in cell wall biosynthesis